MIKHTKIPAIRAAGKLLGGIVLVAAFSHSASAATQSYSFYKLTNNNVEDLSGQLSITMWDWSGANSEFALTGGEALTADQILFTVQNNVGIASNVGEVYFDDADGGLQGPSQVKNSLGGFTNFIGGSANPSNLPAGNTASPPFVASETFSADTAPGNPTNGVNLSGDILGIVLGLDGFGNFDAAAAAVASGDLRFGLHVRSIGAADGSDSYVNEVPIPAAAWLFGSALIGLAGIARKRKAS